MAAWMHDCVASVTSTSILSLPDKMVNPGDKISIPCSLETPGGSVQWVQNGQLVTLDPADAQRRFWNILPDGTAALTIVGVSRKDEGSWECWELGEEGRVRKMTKVLKLTVTSPPQDPFLEVEGRKLAHQATLTVQEHNVVSVHCVVTGAVPPVRKIHWLLGDSDITDLTQLFVEFSSDDDAYVSRSVVTLNVTRELHKKELICKLFHVTWLHPAAVSASINVMYPPTFSISREPGFGYPILEGSSVSLKCDVDANPSSRPVWLRDDGSAPSSLSNGSPSLLSDPNAVKGGFLNFTSITKGDTGWYRCETEHAFGSFASFGYFLNVRDPPSLVEQPPADIGIPSQGDGAHLDCHSNGRPEAEAVNKSLMAIAGHTAYVSVRFCAHPRPIRAHWVIHRLALKAGDVSKRFVAHNYTIGTSHQCYLASLEIRDVRPEDAGEIIFVVKNAKGLDDASVFLNVTIASFSVSSSSAIVSRCFGALVTWLVLCLSRHCHMR